MSASTPASPSSPAEYTPASPSYEPTDSQYTTPPKKRKEPLESESDPEEEEEVPKSKKPKVEVNSGWLDNLRMPSEEAPTAKKCDKCGTSEVRANIKRGGDSVAMCEKCYLTSVAELEAAAGSYDPAVGHPPQSARYDPSSSSKSKAKALAVKLERESDSDSEPDCKFSVEAYAQMLIDNPKPDRPDQLRQWKASLDYWCEFDCSISPQDAKKLLKEYETKFLEDDKGRAPCVCHGCSETRKCKVPVWSTSPYCFLCSLQCSGCELAKPPGELDPKSGKCLSCQVGGICVGCGEMRSTCRIIDGESEAYCVKCRQVCDGCHINQHTDLKYVGLGKDDDGYRLCAECIKSAMQEEDEDDPIFSVKDYVKWNADNPKPTVPSKLVAWLKERDDYLAEHDMDVKTAKAALLAEGIDLETK